MLISALYRATLVRLNNEETGSSAQECSLLPRFSERLEMIILGVVKRGPLALFLYRLFNIRNWDLIACFYLIY